MTRLNARAAALEIRAARYAEAEAMFLCGAVVRQESTPFSDLDLVVVYRRVEHARRESFMHGAWPVEAFIHDPKTLEYFFREVDRPTGVPSLADMVATGIALPAETDLSRSMSELATSVLLEGPPPWSSADVDRSRYEITDLVDDIRAPRTREELLATVARLYPVAANHFFRSRGLWSAKGKRIARRLREVDQAFAEAFTAAFSRTFEEADPEPLIALCERLLQPAGGWLFAGYTLDAPGSWRTP